MINLHKKFNRVEFLNVLHYFYWSPFILIVQCIINHLYNMTLTEKTTGVAIGARNPVTDIKISDIYQTASLLPLSSVSYISDLEGVALRPAALTPTTRVVVFQ